MSSEFRLLSIAELEAAEAAAWYDRQRSALADRFLNEFESALGRISASPLQFPVLEYYRGPCEIRRALLHSFPYALIFLCRPEEIVVVAVTHTRRKPLYWLDRLELDR